MMKLLGKLPEGDSNGLAQVEGLAVVPDKS